MPDGGKAEGLRRLVAAGERVPPYVVVGPGEAPDLAGLGPGPYAVRSSAVGEDGGTTAQAGRYASYLRVDAADVADRVDAVRASYGETPGGVVVQAMVAAQVSGVAFSVHPAGILDQVVVTAGAGAGAVVVDAATTRTWVTATADGRRYSFGTAPDDLLTPAQVDEVVAAALRVARQRGHPVDVEWAYAADGLWLLQARPVTGLPDATVTTLDNSNLVESYPGLVSPLTASFAAAVHEGVFTALARRVTGDESLVAAYHDVVGSLVQVWSGRLYYRMESWYAVLALMPFARRWIGVWQTSLGVQERSYVAEPVRLGRLRRAWTGVQVARALWRAPRELDRLDREVAAVSAWFWPTLRATTTVAGLRAMYDEVERRLLRRWDVTLLNDVRAFVLPALLRRLVHDDAAVNDLVSGIAAMVSLRPARELAALAADAPADLADVTTAEAAEAYLRRLDAYADRLRRYVATYGDRAFEELKLESPTYRSDPMLLVEAVRGFRGAVGEPARPRLASRHPLVRAVARAATRAIAGREASRLDRARVYGMARAAARRAGELLAADGWLDDWSDVWWLTLDELWGADGSGAGDGRERLRDLVAARRRERAAYEGLPAFRRLTFLGEPFDVRVPGAQTSAAGDGGAGDLAGLGVSSGRVSGTVLVVTDPRAVTGADLGDTVLVTPMTDPGWVFLISRARAVVAERGSLLSHTAIVARELGVPAVVGVADATRLLRDGDQVTVDGTAGLVLRQPPTGS